MPSCQNSGFPNMAIIGLLIDFYNQSNQFNAIYYESQSIDSNTYEFYILYFHYKRTKIKSHKLYQQKIQYHINCVHIKN
jgi:hypothetical protein